MFTKVLKFILLMTSLQHIDSLDVLEVKYLGVFLTYNDIHQGIFMCSFPKTGKHIPQCSLNKDIPISQLEHQNHL